MLGTGAGPEAGVAGRRSCWGSHLDLEGLCGGLWGVSMAVLKGLNQGQDSCKGPFKRRRRPWPGSSVGWRTGRKAARTWLTPGPAQPGPNVHHPPFLPMAGQALPGARVSRAFCSLAYFPVVARQECSPSYWSRLTNKETGRHAGVDTVSPRPHSWQCRPRCDQLVLGSPRPGS